MPCIVLSEYELEIFYIFDFILNITNQIQGRVATTVPQRNAFSCAPDNKWWPKIGVVYTTNKVIFLGSTLLNKDLVPVGSIQPVVQIPNDTGNFCLLSSYISIQ